MKTPTKSESQEVAQTEAKAGGFLISLHCPFHLPGQVLARDIPFMGGLELTERWRRELEGGIQEQKQAFAAEQTEARKFMRTLLDLIKGNLSVGAASKALNEAGPRGKDWTQLPERITERLKSTPAIRELFEALFQSGELRFAALDKHVKAGEMVVDSIRTLGCAALDQRDAFATERLVEIAKYAVTMLETLGEQRPELVRPHARKSVQWPVMASVGPDWLSHAQDKLQRKLQLGEDTIHGKFDKSKAYNLENVSRRYARGIVEALQKNRYCAALIKERIEIIKARQKKDGLKIHVQRIPAWVWEAAKLDPFCIKSADDWLDVGIEMLKEQQPHLPHTPDWARIKTHWENRGDKPTAGRLWGSIKDALRSPIKTIARTHKPVKLTQKSPANLGNPNSGGKKA